MSRIVRLAAQLSCTGPEMDAYWRTLCEGGWLPGERPDKSRGIVTAAERLAARAELDILVARDLYGITRDEMEFILGTFPTVRKYETKALGEFRTKRLILDAFDVTDVGLAQPGLLERLKLSSTNEYQAPNGVEYENLVLFALLDVLNSFVAPLAPDLVRAAVALVVAPAVAGGVLDNDEAKEWLRAVGTDARPLPANVARFGTFAGAADYAWAGAVARLKSSGVLVEDRLADTWQARADAPGSGQRWVQGRATVAVELLSRFDAIQLQQNLVRFVKDVEDGKASRAVS